MRKYGLEFPSKYTRNSKILESMYAGVFCPDENTHACVRHCLETLLPP